MKATSLFRVLIVCCAVLGVVATSVRAADDVLNAGAYTAKVKAMTCGGCPPLVKKTMEGLKGIESAAVDRQSSSVEFTVKKDNTVKVADLQTALKAASDKMGMGADYTLSDIKPKGK